MQAFTSMNLGWSSLGFHYFKLPFHIGIPSNYPIQSGNFWDFVQLEASTPQIFLHELLLQLEFSKSVWENSFSNYCWKGIRLRHDGCVEDNFGPVCYKSEFRCFSRNPPTPPLGQSPTLSKFATGIESYPFLLDKFRHFPKYREHKKSFESPSWYFRNFTMVDDSSHDPEPFFEPTDLTNASSWIWKNDIEKNTHFIFLGEMSITKLQKLLKVARKKSPSFKKICLRINLFFF